MKRWSNAVLFFVVLIGAWEVCARLDLLSPVLFPAPSEVGRYLAGAIEDGTLVEASLVTCRRLLFGYGTGLSLGIPLGLMIARYRFVSDTIGTTALGLQTLPSVCWVPLALIWFGQSELAMVFIVIMGSVWSVALATASGVRQVPPIYVRAAQTMGSEGIHTWMCVILPASLPSVVSGMKQGWAFAWRSLMAAEIYVTVLSGFGLGHILHYGRELQAMDAVLGVILIIVLFGLLTDKILFAPFERFLRRRWGTES